MSMTNFFVCGSLALIVQLKQKLFGSLLPPFYFGLIRGKDEYLVEDTLTAHRRPHFGFFLLEGTQGSILR